MPPEIQAAAKLVDADGVAIEDGGSTPPASTPQRGLSSATFSAISRGMSHPESQPMSPLKAIVLWSLLGLLFISGAVYVSFLSERDELTIRDHTPTPAAFQ